LVSGCLRNSRPDVPEYAFHLFIQQNSFLYFGLASKQKKKFLRGKTKFIIFVWASLYKTMLWKYFTEIIYLVLET
ncbi:MAG TPA: hypothetical protein PK566_17935, partial [Pseudobacteroides sp.]|nr:hypothetical protein [Pseudobacteroides sp.]